MIINVGPRCWRRGSASPLSRKHVASACGDERSRYYNGGFDLMVWAGVRRPEPMSGVDDRHKLGGSQ